MHEHAQESSTFWLVDCSHLKILKSCALPQVIANKELKPGTEVTVDYLVLVACLGALKEFEVSRGSGFLGSLGLLLKHSKSLEAWDVTVVTMVQNLQSNLDVCMAELFDSQTAATFHAIRVIIIIRSIIGDANIQFHLEYLESCCLDYCMSNGTASLE